MTSAAGEGIQLEFYTSSFCAACRQTRTVLHHVERMLPRLSLVERDIAAHPDLAERDNIVATPTVIIRSPDGAEVRRATGVPSVAQVLHAVALATDAPAQDSGERA
ncbi:MAG: thioredoxin family protein [Salinibacterium sp.]|nr:thioredoxin family protein [Salinibacterium sp.]MBF0672372.1 thioredoxin family protein [Salinibacterium sp.]